MKEIPEAIIDEAHLSSSLLSVRLHQSLIHF